MLLSIPRTNTRSTVHMLRFEAADSFGGDMGMSMGISAVSLGVSPFETGTIPIKMQRSLRAYFLSQQNLEGSAVHAPGSIEKLLQSFMYYTSQIESQSLTRPAV